jgi:hypothetical protein
MDKAKSSETGSLSNMLGFSMNKEERVLAHLLETKFHTELAIDSRLEVRLNITIKDLVINRLSAKKKSSKRHKKDKSTIKAAKSVGENQPVWLDSSLKVKIAKMK